MSNINKIKDYMKIENDTGGWIKQDIVPCYDKVYKVSDFSYLFNCSV
jgi:hypothetical protein